MLEELFTKEEHHLMEKAATFSIADPIEKILSILSVLSIGSNRVRSLSLVLNQAILLFFDEDLPCKFDVLQALCILHAHE